MAKPRIISLFTGAGGLDYGFEAAGFQTAVALEFDHDCCETLRINRRWPVVERDVFDVPTAELLEMGDLKRGEADLLIGGPPCQPFSKSGYWRRGDALRLEDPRANTLSAYLRVLREALPRAFLLENVEGLAYSGKDEGLRLLLGTIHKINVDTKSNYRPQLAVLNAAAYGVPQLRERVFVVGSRDGTLFEFPRPTHADLDGEAGTRNLFHTAGGLDPYRTAWDAIGDLRAPADEELEVRGRWAGLLPSIPEGHNYLWHTDRMGGMPLFGWRRRYWSFLLKLAKGRPSWTIQAQPGPAIGPFHWANRRLSVRELCRIQTFPDDIRITGTRSSIQKQVGNAVPSLLGEALGREIKAQLLGARRSRTAFKLLPPIRAPVPAPETVQRVPAMYRRLVGDHDAHPGTGQGYGARARLKAAV